MKSADNEVFGTSAYLAGLGLRETILQNGINVNVLKLITDTFKNHHGEKLQDFFAGLLGLDYQNSMRTKCLG